MDNANLPPPLMTSEVGSFAQKIILERKPQIIKRVIADHDYPPDIVENLHQFAAEIAERPVAALSDNEEDTAFWNAQWAQHAAKTWLEIPWYFAEAYFYRRLLEATRYFQLGEQHHQDPFLPQKIAQEDAALQQLAAFYLFMQIFEEEDLFTFTLHAALWGNRSDLSNFTVQETAEQGKNTVSLRKFILINHSQAVYEYLQSGVTQVSFVNDNVGADTINDLLLADFLLSHDWAQTVTFHLKHRPFFVSDAMPTDIIRVVQKMERTEGLLQPLGKRLSAWVQDGRLQLLTDPFWVSCLTFNQLPIDVYKALAQSNLVILKGDVNYRRLLDDRHWSSTTKVEDIAGDFPRPFLILRTLKGEIIAGLAEGEAQRIAADDPTWLINGKRSIIQLVKNS